MNVTALVRRYLRLADNGISLVNKERRGIKAVDVPWSRRARSWTRGYLGESELIYDTTSFDRGLYVSDFSRFIRSPMINFGGSSPVLNDKLIFFYAMRTLGAPVPEVHGLVERHGITWIDPPPTVRRGDGPMWLLESGHELVLKPVDGGGGRGVSVLTMVDGVPHVNGARADERAISELLVRGTLIQELVRQGTYAAQIFPGTANTLRVVTMWDYDRNEPFVARAVHRFGTARSAPVDNWSRGALSVAVDTETGTLGAGVAFPTHGRLEWHARHPDTGAQITGTAVPNWPYLKAELMRIADRLPRLLYVGWDVLVDDDRVHIIEGNSFPDVNLVQVHEPLLTDARIRTFFERHGVVSSPT